MLEQLYMEEMGKKRTDSLIPVLRDLSLGAPTAVPKRIIDESEVKDYCEHDECEAVEEAVDEALNEALNEGQNDESPAGDNTAGKLTVENFILF